MADSEHSPIVVIVEDDAHIAYLLGYLAQKEGFVVEPIADGRAAAARLAAEPVPDLVLLDVMLPYADGFELLAKLRATAGWEQVPVIVITSKVHEQDAVRALALGADDYLTKPFSPLELVARMRRRMQRA
jgi:DNA-binding response OmpR family regulator